MIFDLIKKNRTLRELIYGILLYTLLGEILIVLFTKQTVYNSIGFLVGAVISLACSVHMAYGIEIAVMLDEKSSIAFTRKYTVIRYLVMCIALAVVGVFDFGSPVTLIFGYLGLKMGAYINPLIHRIIVKIFGGEDLE